MSSYTSNHHDAVVRQPLSTSTARGEALRQAWCEDPIAAFEAWMARARGGRGFSPRSATVYRTMWRKFVHQAGAQAALASVEELGQFLATVTVKGKTVQSPSQQRRYLALVALVQDELVETGCLQVNAARTLLNEAPMREAAHRRNLPVALAPEQEAQLRAHLEEQEPTHWVQMRDRALIELLLGSALKVGELQSLRVGDLVIETASASHVSVTTNGRRERRAPMAEASKPAVMAWRDQLIQCGAGPTDYVMLSSESDDEGGFDPELDFAFDSDLASRFARPMSSAQIWRVVHATLRAAGLDDRLAKNGPTVLRNTFATRQLRAGVRLEVVARWLGHKNPRSTEVFRALILNPTGAR